MPKNRRWLSVKKTSPCPKCGATSWCRFTDDGQLVTCRHEAAGAYQTKHDKNGAPYYLHRLGDGPSPSPRPAPPPERPPEIAPVETRDAVYRAMLAKLPLSARSKRNLEERGLGADVIARNGFGYLPVRGRAKVAKALHEEFGDHLLRVPGFGSKEGDGGPYLTVFGAAGMLIPVRDLAGRVVALKVRRDDPDGEPDGKAKNDPGPRYLYISSASCGGAGPGSPAHVPLGVTGPCELVGLTEGELKADVAFARGGIPVISAPGVANWRPCLDVLRSLGAKTVRLLFDADAVRKSEVACAQLACAEALLAEGYAVELGRWGEADGKGIDDLLVAGKEPEILAGDAALQEIQALARRHFWEEWPTAESGPTTWVIACGADRPCARDIASNLQTAALPAGWAGLTAIGSGPPPSLLTFAAGKAVLLVRGTFDEPHREPSERLAAALAAAGAAEVRQLCPGWSFLDQPHDTAEIAALWESGQPFVGQPAGAADLSSSSPESDACLDRLAEALASGDPAAVFRDHHLLQTLAALSVDRPADFAVACEKVKAAKVSLRNLDAVLKPLRQSLQSQRPAPSAEQAALEPPPVYLVQAGCLCRLKHAADSGAATISPLCNFQARIVEQTIHDDGAEQHHLYTTTGELADREALPATRVPAEDFSRMDWPVSAWGHRAVVYAGQGNKDHLCCALQILSGDAPRRVVYGHLGWRQVGDGWVYLHGGGAIGASGLLPEVPVSPPPALERFVLPEPPEGDRLRGAVRASLNLLALGPDRVAFPMLAAVYRAVLGDVDCSVFLLGPTGSYKSERAALHQQHFGAGMDRLNLPANFTSTGNALEGLAFAAKDALLVIDDFCPVGAAADVQRYHKDADRIFRAQGNRAGRLRLRADSSVRPARPPRGLLLATGEDLPRGQSLNSRLLTLEVGKAETDLTLLSACQRDAASGAYALCLAGFLHWLAPRYEEVRGRLRDEAAALRTQAAAQGQHARTPGIVADLALGLKYLLAFAREVRAVDDGEVERLTTRGWTALLEAGAAQAEHIRAADPVEQFLRLLGGALASGRGHIADPRGMEPARPEAWGWRGKEYETRGPDGEHDTAITYTAQGRCLGWADRDNLYLEPEAAYAEVQELARHQGEHLSVTARVLWKRMREKGVLATWDEARKRNTVRRDLAGVRHREVIHLPAATLLSGKPSPPSTGSATDNGHTAGSKATNGPVDGFGGRFSGPVDGFSEEPSTGNCHCGSENLQSLPSSGRCGRSFADRRPTQGGNSNNGSVVGDSELF